MTKVEAQVQFDVLLRERASPNELLGIHRNNFMQAATCSSWSLRFPHMAGFVSLHLSRLSKIVKVLFLG